MSDMERDQIDNGSQKIINSCSHIIQEFKKESRKIQANPQMIEFMDSVLKIVENYLKAVCAIHTEQKALRVKRALDLRKLTKLEVEKKPPLDRRNSNEIIEELLGNSNRSSDNDVKDGSTINNKNTLAIATEMDSSTLSEDDQLSAEEMQIFESENLQLYGELNSLSEEVKQIESKVLHIAELQEVFTEKVLQQDQDVDRIAGTVMGVNENVRDANEQIRQAIQRNAGLRVWVLFFLLVMSFSLLFLDWYND
ncbi:syntaxin 18 isoform X2 [Arctopsyche grandis]